VTRRQLAKIATRQKVLEAAKSAFETHGYEAATIRWIALAAGMSTGAVFANFKDKGELYAEIYDHPPISPEVGARLMRAARELLRSNPEVAGARALAAAVTLTGVRA
jgi:AcrR family transcriptional regulator